MTPSLQLLTRLGCVTVVATLALLASVSYAQWQEPTAPPPQANVAPPLSVSGVDQEKAGDLTVGGLAVNGRPLLRHPNPTITLLDSDGRDWWLQADANGLYFQGDRTNNGLWGDDGSPALRLYETTLPFGAFRAIAAFSNQVRAVAYCDRFANNCWNPAVDGVSSDGSAPSLPSCATGQTLEYSGSDWECAEDDTGGDALSLPMSCSSGQALTGIDSRGRAQCAALPPRECVYRDRTYSSGYTCLTGTESASVGTRYWYRTCTHEGTWLHGQYTSTGRSSYPRC